MNINSVIKSKYSEILRSPNRNKIYMLVFIALFAIIGIVFLLSSQALLLFASIEPESGRTEGCVSVIEEASATGGKAIQFNGDCSGRTRGAKLPINYSPSAISSNAKYVSATGSDSATGTLSNPYKTLAKAISSAPAGSDIVIRGGVYREGNLNIDKSLRIIAYPGETPVFNGSADFTGGWINEGGLAYRPYSPQPVTDGSGISFTTGQNLNDDKIGRHPDQLWIDGRQLKQISQKSQINLDSFWVDAANKRIYINQSNSAKQNIEASSKNMFGVISAPNTTIEGLTITKYSDSAKDAAAVLIRSSASNSIIRQVVVSETAFTAIKFGDDSKILNNVRLENSTIERSNWMGIVALYTDNFVIDGSLIKDMNPANEFAFAPQSGALKTSRTRYTKVINSDILNNNSQGLWFDQSNIDVDVANNNIIDNNGSGLFFEISDDLLMINNYIKSSGTAQPVKLAGSSGLKIVNNTIVGGANPIGIYTDYRSIPGCSDTTKPLCANSYSSDRDTLRPPSPNLDWMPRLDLMINNIISYPTAQLYCGSITPVCITSSNGVATAPIGTIIHKADAARGIPQTKIDSNVYANGNGNIIVTSTGSYKSTGSFMSAMANAPISIIGLEANGKSGNNLVGLDGRPTNELINQHSQASPIPTQPNINEYIQAGIRKFGKIDH